MMVTVEVNVTFRYLPLIVTTLIVLLLGSRRRNGVSKQLRH
ncbi:hypothetical protein [Bartonella sp. CL63NXGY]